MYFESEEVENTVDASPNMSDELIIYNTEINLGAFWKTVKLDFNF